MRNTRTLDTASVVVTGRVPSAMHRSPTMHRLRVMVDHITQQHTPVGTPAAADGEQLKTSEDLYVPPLAALLLLSLAHAAQDSCRTYSVPTLTA